MALERTKEKKTQECRIGLMFLQKRSSHCLKKLLIIVHIRKALKFLQPRVAILTGLMFDNRAVELFLSVEIPEDDGLVDLRMRRKIASRRSSKPLLRK